MVFCHNCRSAGFKNHLVVYLTRIKQQMLKKTHCLQGTEYFNSTVSRLALVVEMLDSTIHQKNHYPSDKS